MAFDLPGQWDEAPSDGGHDLRKHDRPREEVVVSILPTLAGLDATASTLRMNDAQRHGMAAVCKQGETASASAPVPALPGGVRFHVTCGEPRLVATFVAAQVEGQVLSYEHYWYEVPVFSEALDTADDAIVSNLRVKSACPPEIFKQATGHVGACLEAAVLGQATVEHCARDLTARGWTPDDMATKLVGQRSGRKIVCYRVPQ